MGSAGQCVCKHTCTHTHTHVHGSSTLTHAGPVHLWCSGACRRVVVSCHVVCCLRLGACAVICHALLLCRVVWCVCASCVVYVHAAEQAAACVLLLGCWVLRCGVWYVGLGRGETRSCAGAHYSSGGAADAQPHPGTCVVMGQPRGATDACEEEYALLSHLVASLCLSVVGSIKCFDSWTALALCVHSGRASAHCQLLLVGIRARVHLHVK